MKSKYLLLALLAMASCTQEEMPGAEEMQKPEANVVGQYRAALPGFTVESAGESILPQSRVGINKDVTGFSWQADDVIGIFPKSNKVEGALEGDQVYFNIIPDPSSNDGKVASFDGGGWQAKEGYSYWAYCPFNREGGFGQNKTAMYMDFTNQVWNKDNNYLSKRVYMLSEGKVDNSNKKFLFDFKALTCLGICKMDLSNIEYADRGYIESMTFEFTDGTQPFVETATFDVTQASNLVGEGQELPVNAITPTKTSSTFTLTAPTAEGERYEFGPVPDKHQQHSFPKGDWLFSLPALQGIAGKTCRVTLNVVSTASITGGKSFVYTTDFTFSKDWVPGHAYVLKLDFPSIDKDKNYIHSEIPGSLRLSHVQAAMNGTGKLKINGVLNAKDYEVLRKAAGSAILEGEDLSKYDLLTDLDLWGADFEGSDDFMTPFTMPSLAGTKLTRLVLPNYYMMTLGAEALKGVPLKTLEWENYMYSNEDCKVTADPKAFDGFTTEGCDLKISKSLNKYLSAGTDGGMLFNGRKFNSYQQRTWKYDYGDAYDYSDIVTTTVDAQTNTITTHVPGFITAENITTALNGGHKLIVKGNINGADIKAIREAAGCSFKANESNIIDNPDAVLTDLDLSGANIKKSDIAFVNTSDNQPFSTYDNTLGTYMFKSSALTSIKLPASVTSFGMDVFRGSTKLATIELPANVTDLGTGTFAHTAITSITISSSVQLADQLFKGCNQLTSIIVEDGCVLDEFYITSLFEGFTNSANCDLVIPDAWKDKVTAADGKVMFCGVAWKSVKSADTGLGFDNLPDYEPGLNF